jgi:hypothetical protein
MLDEWPVNSDPSCSHGANLAPGKFNPLKIAGFVLRKNLWIKIIFVIQLN